MEHYSKGRNEEEELNSANIPLIGIPQGHGWMLITGGTRLQTALGPACTLIKEEGTLVLAGVGSSIQKVETLAGMVKMKMTGLFQVNKAGERVVREYWDPKSDDLDHLVVTRIQPTLHILLSMERIECEGEKVISPASKESGRKKKNHRGDKEKHPPKKLQSGAAKNTEQEGNGKKRSRRGKPAEKQDKVGGDEQRLNEVERVLKEGKRSGKENSEASNLQRGKGSNNQTQPSQLLSDK